MKHVYPYKKNPYIPLTKYPEMYDYERLPFNTKIQIEPSLQVLQTTMSLPISSLNPIAPINPMHPIFPLNSISPVSPMMQVTQQNMMVPQLLSDYPESPTVKYVKKRSLTDEQVVLMEENVEKPSDQINHTVDSWQGIPPYTIFRVPPSNEAIPALKVPYKVNLKREKYSNIKIKKNRDSLNELKIPHFHVTYWMFYPYSEGKSLCTLNLGPLGPLPIPLLPIFNICLGTRKEFGSHVGDWEHVSLFFKGKLEPDVS